jgi:RecA/RadA recombinase
MKFPIRELNNYFESIDPLQGIFSIWGDFGVGKTTFALQTAINAGIHKERVIYVYTKPNLPYEKIFTLSKTSKDILDSIIIIKPLNFKDLHKIIFNLEFLFLKKLTPKEDAIKLIVIDSITNLYRLELNQDKKEKNYNLNYQLNQILANLTYLNEIYDIQILVVNELSRRTQNDQLIEVQSGGKVMEFWVNYNLKISKTKNLHERKFTFTNISENNIFEFTSNLNELGFA